LPNGDREEAGSMPDYVEQYPLPRAAPVFFIYLSVVSACCTIFNSKKIESVFPKKETNPPVLMPGEDDS